MQRVWVEVSDCADMHMVRHELGETFENGAEVAIDTLITALPKPHDPGYTGDRHPQELGNRHLHLAIV